MACVFISFGRSAVNQEDFLRTAALSSPLVLLAVIIL